MWSLKVNEQQKPSTVSSRPHSKQQQKSSKQTLPTLKTTNEATTDASVQNEPPILPDNESKTIHRNKLSHISYFYRTNYI
jgi:hypothetical protein